MAFTLTKYIYPIKEKIVLSEHLGYAIDNPRTEEEILFIKKYIQPALKRHHENSGPNYNPMLSAAFAISEWREYIKETDVFLYDFLIERYEMSIEDIISQSWIILRYDDNGEFEKAKIDRSVFFEIFYSDTRHAYWEKYNRLQSYCQIISLLIHDDNDRYIGDSFVLLRKPQSIFYPLDHTHEIIEAFGRFQGNCSVANDSKGKTWDFFPDVRERLISTSHSIDKFLKEEKLTVAQQKKKSKLSAREKILFIGDLLRVIEDETQDVKVKLLLLVSIIEFVVTRKPDVNRFNIEDSIMKQFVLKASIIIYQNSNDANLEEVKENLKRVYSQRSDVAHGNYISIEETKALVNSFYLLYKYIRAIVIEYTKSPQFIDFVKEN